MEPFINIGLACPKHGPRPNPELHDKDPHEYIGCFVKKLFRGTSGGLPMLTGEHMWIKVIGANGATLVGELDSDPLLDHGLVAGDVVEMQIEEIEELIKGD